MLILLKDGRSVRDGCSSYSRTASSRGALVLLQDGHSDRERCSSYSRMAVLLESDARPILGRPFPSRGVLVLLSLAWSPCNCSGPALTTLVTALARNVTSTRRSEEKSHLVLGVTANTRSLVRGSCYLWPLSYRSSVSMLRRINPLSSLRQHVTLHTSKMLDRVVHLSA